MFNGKRLAEMRTLRSMSQEKLGEVIGVTRSAINKYEVGVVTNVKISDVERLAAALMCQAAYLVDWCDEPFLETGHGEGELLDAFRELNEEGQQLACASVRGFVALGEYKKHDPLGMVSEK